MKIIPQSLVFWGCGIFLFDPVTSRVIANLATSRDVLVYIGP